MVLIRRSIRPISTDSTKIILKQIEECVCVGLNKKGEPIGTAFFCEIPINNKNVPVMISCDFNFSNFEQSDYINLLYNGEIKTLNLNEDREIYLDKNLMILIIEILPDIDNININNFLEVDLDGKLEKDENVYILQYHDEKSFISYGIIYEVIDGHKIIHYYSTEEGSSGSPILNLKNNKVVGVHYGSSSSGKNFNYGTFLKYPIMDFIKKYKNKYNDKDFTNLKLLSIGSYGDIYSAYSVKDRIEVCLKKINLEKMKLNYQSNELNNYKKDLRREINITKLLSNNENSLKYLGSYNNKTEKVLVLEKCDLNLYQFINGRQEALSLEEIRNKFSKMNKLFKEFQEKNIIHRDIKLENFLIKYTNKEKTDYVIKLCDYGMGKFKDGIFSGLKGTFETIPPEILLKKTSHYEDKLDIFSLGVILFQLSNNLRHPFGIYYPEIVINYEKNFETDNFAITFDDNIKDKQFIDLVTKMLKINPINRLQWDSYFEHPFFQEK